MFWFQLHELRDLMLFLVNQKSVELLIKQKTREDVTFSPANMSLNFCHQPEHENNIWKKINNQLLFFEKWNPGYFEIHVSLESSSLTTFQTTEEEKNSQTIRAVKWYKIPGCLFYSARKLQMIVSTTTRGDTFRSAQTSNTQHQSRACDYLPLQHHLSLWTCTCTQLHVAFYKSPAADNKNETNVKHKTHRYTYCTNTADTPDLQQHLRRPNAWKATCVRAKILQPSEHAFRLPLMKLVQLHNASFLSRFWDRARPIESRRGRKKQNKKNRKKLVSFSWQWELLLCWSTTWANIKETSKPEHRQKTSCPSCPQRSGKMMIFSKYIFPPVSIMHFLSNTVT